MVIFLNMVKKKYIIFTFLLIISTIYLSADDNFLPKDLWVTEDRNGSPEFVFNFQGNNVTKSLRLDEILDKGVFKIEYVNNVPFLIINWQKGITVRYLMLANENNFMLLYDRDNVRPLYTLYYYGKELPGVVWYGQALSNPINITASSILTENNITYPPSNMSNWRINSVWAEGVPGHGINETVTFYTVQAECLYISIGYVSYSHPELYMENSRPKRIRVTFGSGSKEIILKDTPAYQIIDNIYPFSTKITIQILEVYTGTKYEDTCINSIINHFSQ
jgi:hypothetical protein